MTYFVDPIAERSRMLPKPILSDTRVTGKYSSTRTEMHLFSSGTHSDIGMQDHAQGCVVHGLSLQGAQWDSHHRCMVQPDEENGGLAAMPAMRLRPTLRSHDTTVMNEGTAQPPSINQTAATTVQRSDQWAQLSEQEGSETETVQLSVDIFQTASRGRSAPPILTINLPAACTAFNKFRTKECTRDSGWSLWVLQSAALLCVDGTDRHQEQNGASL